MYDVAKRESSSVASHRPSAVGQDVYDVAKRESSNVASHRPSTVGQDVYDITKRESNGRGSMFPPAPSDPVYATAASGQVVAGEVLPDNNQPMSCIALFNYVPEGGVVDGLTLFESDIVIVEDTSDRQWWFGAVGDRVGWFPASYVENLDGISEDLPHVDPASRQILAQAARKSIMPSFEAPPEPDDDDML